MGNIHNLLCDLDQTLLDFHATEHKALEIVVKSNGLQYSEELYEHFKTLNKSLWIELEKGTITRKELFTIRFNDLIEKCGGDARMIDPLSMNDEFIRTMSQNGILMEGALEFVERIKRDIEGARIYILSNGATINAEGRIRTTGLDRYLDGVFISEALGVNKPAKEFFDICLSEIGATKESCIMIGDSLSSDMLGARNASLSSVWFMPTGDIESAMKEYDIDYCADSYDELYMVLKEWSARD